MNHRPPKRPLQFLRWFCREDYLEEIEGDLTEVFIKQAESHPRQAKWKFTWSVMKYFRPAFMKSFKSYHPNVYGMYKNYLKISWRNLVKQKMYSSIKVGGFALGVAACLLMALFIKDELSYDRHYSPQIYRVLGVIIDEGDVKKGLAFPAPMAAALKEDFAEVKEAGRYNGSELFGAGSSEVRLDGAEENTYDEGFVYFDQALLNMLELPFIYGNPKTALSQPRALVITKRKADKYFPNLDPVGKLLIVNNRADKPYTIAGVIEDFKATSHIQFDFLIGTEGLEFWNGEQKNWGASNYATYIKVQKGVDVAALEAKISRGIIEKYLVPGMLKDGMPQAEIDKIFIEKNAHLELQPLQKVHLYSGDIDDSLVHGDIRIVWLFGGIALFVLLIAVINFVNLSTAKSANRAKEIGLRKAMGSLRSNIVSQFLHESVLFSLISFIIGIALAALLLPYFNFISGKSISMPWTTYWYLPSIVALAVMVGLLAGIYPSLYLSAFKPIQVLKGNLTRGAKSSPLRSTLVVFQFTTSIILIIGTVVIYRQMNFILNKKVGYDKEQVLLLQGTNTLGTQVASFADELRALPQVVAVSTADYFPCEDQNAMEIVFGMRGAKILTRE